MAASFAVDVHGCTTGSMGAGSQISEYGSGRVDTAERRGGYMKADEVISRVVDLCREYDAKKVILYGSRAKGTAGERSDIDIAVSGVAEFDELLEKVEELPTLYSVDLLNMDTCRNDLLMEDIKQYGREI